MKGTPLTSNQKAMLRRRGLDPADYVVLKKLNFILFLLNKKTNTIKVIDRLH